MLQKLNTLLNHAPQLEIISTIGFSIIFLQKGSIFYDSYNGNTDGCHMTIGSVDRTQAKILTDSKKFGCHVTKIEFSAKLSTFGKNKYHHWIWHQILH